MNKSQLLKKRPYTKTDSEAFMAIVRAEANAFFDQWVKIYAGDKEAWRQKRAEIEYKKSAISSEIIT